MFKQIKLLLFSIIISIIYINFNPFQSHKIRELITMTEYNESCITINNSNYLVQYIGNLSNTALNHLDYSRNITLWDSNNSSVVVLKIAIHNKLY